MALITISDLPQSDVLDREAMRSIVGGARTGARAVLVEQVRVGQARSARARVGSVSLVDYPPGCGDRGGVLGRSQRPTG